jgi:hypothetical protein
MPKVLARMLRPLAALLTVVAAGVIALVLVFVALFSDWSGQHTINPIPLMVGIVVLILGLSVAVRILRGSSAEGGP